MNINLKINKFNMKNYSNYKKKNLNNNQNNKIIIMKKEYYNKIKKQKILNKIMRDFCQIIKYLLNNQNKNYL